MPKDFGRWVVGALVAIVGLFALYLASNAEDSVMYYTGIFFFIGCVLFNFLQIKQVYDAQSAH
jgi:hypothetical protein